MPTADNVIKDKIKRESMQNHGVLKSRINEFTLPSDVIVDSLFKGNEYSLISHIENLKRLANDESIKGNVNKNGQPSTLPNVFNVSNNARTTGDSLFQKSRSPSLLWTIDPASEPGNLKAEAPHHSSLALDDVFCIDCFASEKNTEGKDESQYLEKSSNKERTSRMKSSKRLCKCKRKERKTSTKIISQKAQENGHKTLSLGIYSKYVSNNIPDPEGLDSLTALCQGVKIHEKVDTFVKSKKSSLSCKHTQSVSTSNNNHSIKLTPAMASLNNAITEYTKKTLNPSTQLDSYIRRKGSNGQEDMVKTTKVYLSEKQSGIISDAGSSYPCAPPTTPTAEQMRRYEYVPSMQDIRSQRSIKQKLQMMEIRAMKKEKKKLDENHKQEQLSMRERRLEMKKQQRREIYALNKVMTDLENVRFHHFMSHAESNIS